MQATTHIDTDRYAKCIEISRRVRWDIDKMSSEGGVLIFPRNSCRTAFPKSTSLNS